MLKLLQINRLPSISLTQAWSSSIRDLSTSSAARFSRFQEKFRITSQRRPVAAPKASETQKVVDPVHSDQIPVRPARDLWKAALYTVGIGAGTYTVAAVFEYERMKRMQRDIFSYFNSFSLQNMQSLANESQERSPLTTGAKVAIAIIGLNCLVTALWRIPKFQAAMYRYFTNSFASKSLCSPMLLSVFSHNNLVHLGANMYVLYSFVPVSLDRFLGVENFLALYLTAGVFSSFTSLVHKYATKSNIRALGASGAICALLAYTCMKIPDARLSIIFMPFIQFSAQHAVYGLIAFDLLGLIFRFRMFDHAAHLGGTLFGVLYAMYGEHWIRHQFNPKVFKLCREAEKKTS